MASRQRAKVVWTPKPLPLRVEDFEFAYHPALLRPSKNGKVRPATRAELHENARRHIARLRAQYVVSRNPLHALTAYQEARRAGVEIPDWVDGYLDLAWRNLMDLSNDPPAKGKIAGAIAAAFGFVSGGAIVTKTKNSFEGGQVPLQLSGSTKSPYANKKSGQFNPFVEDRRFELAAAVCRHLLSGSSPLYAYQHAAAEHRVHQRTAERAWAAYRSQFPAPPDDTK